MANRIVTNKSNMLTYCRYLNIFICTVVCVLTMWWPGACTSWWGGQMKCAASGPPSHNNSTKEENYKTIFLTRWLSSTPRQAIHVLFRVFPIIPSPEPEIIRFWAAVPDCSVLVDSMPQLLSFSIDWGQMVAAVRSFTSDWNTEICPVTADTKRIWFPCIFLQS